MAHFSGSFLSETLQRKVPLTAVIPTRTEMTHRNAGNDKDYPKPIPAIYLLHGWDGSNDDWLVNARIAELARKYHIAFIMPAGENSFYLDHPNGNAYGQYIGEELVKASRELFPLSTKREDTWLAGLSMGGYGALRNGFKYSETFSKVAAFSSRILSKRDAPNNEPLEDHLINNHLKAIIQSDTLADLRADDDPYDLVINRKQKQDLYLAVGFDDFLYDENKDFHHYLEEEGIEHGYHESAGGHDWDFWNKHIEKSVQWMVAGK